MPANSRILIRGGTVIDATGSRKADVVVEAGEAHGGGRVVAVGDDIGGDASADSLLDASGCIVAPGLVDIHVHLRQPGFEEAETIETAARGAALGGFTAVVAMPNTNPAIDCAAIVREVKRLSKNACCAVYPSAAITVGRKGERLTSMAGLVRLGVRIFTDDGDGVQNVALMRRAMEYASSLDHLIDGGSGDGGSGDRSGIDGGSGGGGSGGRSGIDGGSGGGGSGGRSGIGGRVVLAQHCEVAELSAGTYMHEGEWSSRLGIPGQPSEAESLMVVRDIALSRLTGARVHFLHLSTEAAVDAVRDAKQAGLPVTAEATPHHFTLTDASCAGFDTVFKVHPPLRSDKDVAAIKAGLADGTIDAIATDHAPHTSATKKRPFDSAPPGMIGLETALALALTELELPIEKILALMSWQPAAIAGIDDSQGGPIMPGVPANLCVIDPNVGWTVSGTAMASLSSNTPFEGRTLKGRVRHTISAGEAVVVDGEAQR